MSSGAKRVFFWSTVDTAARKSVDPSINALKGREFLLWKKHAASFYAALKL